MSLITLQDAPNRPLTYIGGGRQGGGMRGKVTWQLRRKMAMCLPMATHHVMRSTKMLEVEEQEHWKRKHGEHKDVLEWIVEPHSP